MTAASGQFEIDRDLLDDQDGDVSVYVRASSPELAASALNAAAPRLALVTFDGREWPNWESLNEAVLATDGSFETDNANFVHDVEQRSDGAFIVLDTKGEGPGDMSRAVVRIVTEELSRLGVDRAALRPVNSSDW